MSLRVWFRPPRLLLLVLLSITLLSASALSWLGWKVLEQQRLLEVQRVQERLEQTADRLAATIRGTLAEAGERVSGWAAAPPAESEGPQQGLLLIFTPHSLAAFPRNRLLYYPFPSPEPEAPAGVFAGGEDLEFRQENPQRAAESYRRLVDSPDISIRAGALLRLARALRKAGQRQAALAAYERVARLGTIQVAGAPAELVAGYSRCALLAELGKNSKARQEAGGLLRALLGGRWHLTRGQFEFYHSGAGRMLGAAGDRPADAALADAATSAWEDWKRSPTSRGQRLAWVEGRAYLTLWRSAASRHAVLVVQPDFFLKRIPEDRETRYALTDAEGRVVAGQRESGGRAAIRTAVESELPWTLHVSSVREGSSPSVLWQGRFLLLGLSVMLIFLLTGSYFIGRAVQREMEVARLQSDFVSGVSHEFRTPLTTVRQLSEILAFGRVPSEQRRERYYETLVSESKRLQQLVETLLNFGKMEAGVRQYRFEMLDPAVLVEKVVAEFEPQMSASGRHIQVSGARDGARIHADPEALSVALRNLVDNALKYSPDCPAVWVEWGPEGERLAIRVRDRGLGIPASERKAIFQKFVRGSAAATANVKGTGVGLAMVQHIVSAHGGEIHLESEPGAGSTFTVLLPAVDSL
jgi:signal transduction histidine kinase